jgi:hypothetical protein
MRSLNCPLKDRNKILQLLFVYFLFHSLKIFILGWAWWHTAVISATQEVEIGESSGQSRQMLARPYLKNKPGMAVHSCSPSSLEGGGWNILVLC